MAKTGCNDMSRQVIAASRAIGDECHQRHRDFHRIRSEPDVLIGFNVQGRGGMLARGQVLQSREQTLFERPEGAQHGAFARAITFNTSP